MFIGREVELQRLEKMYKSNKLEFVTVYGRRRVGKTTLINHFIKGKRSIFFACQKSSPSENLAELSRQVSTFLGYGVTFPSFTEAFRAIIRYAIDERLLFVIDEYPYLAKKDDNAISSIIQNILDHEAKETKLFLILSGSSVSFMEDEVLGKESPLHGRITAQFLVKPFDYLDSSRFVPSYSSADKAIVYGVTGGIPRYLELFDDSVSLKENLLYNIFDSNSVLFNERENYLKEEFSEVSTYSSILNAIANGCTKVTDIASRAGIQTGALPSYLRKLKEVGVIDKLVPLGESEKKGIWRICDLFFRFHSFFVSRNISTIVSARIGESFDKVVSPFINDYMGKVFEEISKQYIQRYADLPFPLSLVGTWWGGSRTLHKEIEIDIVAESAVSSDKIIGSVKFRERKIGSEELDLMRSYSREMGGAGNFLYWFFSKSGFDEDFKKLAKEDKSIRLYTIDDLYHK